MRGPSFEKNLNPIHPRMPYAKFGWNMKVVLEKKVFKISFEMKMWKVYDNNDNDDGQIVVFGSGQLKRLGSN